MATEELILFLMNIFSSDSATNALSANKKIRATNNADPDSDDREDIIMKEVMRSLWKENRVESFFQKPS